MNNTRSSFRTVIALLLIAVLILGSTVTSAAKKSSSSTAASQTSVLSDIKGTHYENAVTQLIDLKVITGYEDGTFKPDNNITRAETCVVISKSMNPSEEKYQAAGSNGFSDMHSGYDWAAQYVNYAAAMGAVDGYPDGSFKPANNVTYDELSAMILKGMGYKASGLEGSWPLNFRNQAKSLGLYDEVFANLTDEEKEAFDYSAPATRGNTALMIVKGVAELQERGKADLPAKKDEGQTGDHVYEDGRYDWIEGEAKTLALAQAVYIMKNEGYLAEMAKLYEQSDKNTAKGYGDNVDDLKDGLNAIKTANSKLSEAESAVKKAEQSYKNPTEKDLEISEEDRYQNYTDAMNAYMTAQATVSTLETTLTNSGVTKANLEMAKIMQKYAQEYIDENNEAFMNNIEKQTVSLYYGVLQAQENLKVCEDNLAVQNQMMDIVNAKFTAGKAPKAEVSAQKSAVISAENDVKSAKASLESAKMSFNLLMGYEVMENVEYKDVLSVLPFPQMTLQQAIDSALENRLTYVTVKYAYELQSMALKYIKSSSKSTAYQKQENATKQMELQLANTPKSIEIEIRNSYIALNNLYDGIAAAQDTLALAEEALRIKKLLYDVGMCTLADVNAAQVTVYQTNQLLMSKICAYDVAVYDFKYATGVGTERVTF